MSDAPPETPESNPLRRTAPAPRRADPAVLVLILGGIVLAAALWWLVATPRATRTAEMDAARIGRLETRFDALDGLREQTAALGARVEQLGPLESRLRAVEERPGPPDIRPLQEQIGTLAERVAADERAIAQNAERAIANERRLTAVEGRPVFDPAAVPNRAAFDGLAGRVERLAERTEANAGRLGGIEAEVNRRLEAAASDQNRRSQEASRSLEERVRSAEQSASRRASELEAEISKRVEAAEKALGERIAAVERSQQRLSALEDRTARLAAIDGLQRALSAGEPLGRHMGRIEQPPQALARFAQTPPPTEASLRLSFEDAARAARAASDPGASAASRQDGNGGGGERPGVMDSALARLGGLVTVRRGEQVVWGDAAEAEIERARRALDAGDLEGALGYIGKLPSGARAAMDNWTEQARALIAARNALRQIAGTAG